MQGRAGRGQGPGWGSGGGVRWGQELTTAPTSPTGRRLITSTGRPSAPPATSTVVDPYGEIQHASVHPAEFKVTDAGKYGDRPSGSSPFPCWVWRGLSWLGEWRSKGPGVGWKRSEVGSWTRSLHHRSRWKDHDPRVSPLRARVTLLTGGHSPTVMKEVMGH